MFFFQLAKLRPLHLQSRRIRRGQRSLRRSRSRTAGPPARAGLGCKNPRGCKIRRNVLISKVFPNNDGRDFLNLPARALLGIQGKHLKRPSQFRQSARTGESPCFRIFENYDELYKIKQNMNYRPSFSTKDTIIIPKRGCKPADTAQSRYVALHFFQ